MSIFVIAALAAAILLPCWLLIAWLLLSELLRSPNTARMAFIVGAFCLILLVAIQCASGYSPAIRFGTLIIYALGAFGYLLALLLVATGPRMPFHINRVAAIFGLIVPCVMMLLSAPVLLYLGAVFMAKGANKPTFIGRLSPTRTYAIYPGYIVNSEVHPLYYTIYENPPHFPFIRKEGIDARLPCETPPAITAATITPSPGLNVAVLTCQLRNGETEVQTISIN